MPRSEVSEEAPRPAALRLGDRLAVLTGRLLEPDYLTHRPKYDRSGPVASVFSALDAPNLPARHLAPGPAAGGVPMDHERMGFRDSRGQQPRGTSAGGGLPGGVARNGVGRGLPGVGRDVNPYIERVCAGPLDLVCFTEGPDGPDLSVAVPDERTAGVRDGLVAFAVAVAGGRTSSPRCA